MLAGCPAYPEEIGEVTTVGEPDDKGWARPMPPPVSELVMGVSSGLDQVLRRALSTEPGERYAAIEDFVAALREVSDPGAVWDDGATVIWSPAAGDMEPPVPPPPPIDERGRAWLQPRQRPTTAKMKALRLGGRGALPQVQGRRVARAEQGSVAARADAQVARDAAAGRGRGPVTGVGISATPMAFASFPTVGDAVAADADDLPGRGGRAGAGRGRRDVGLARRSRPPTAPPAESAIGRARADDPAAAAHRRAAADARTRRWRQSPPRRRPSGTADGRHRRDADTRTVEAGARALAPRRRQVTARR